MLLTEIHTESKTVTSAKHGQGCRSELEMSSYDLSTDRINTQNFQLVTAHDKTFLNQLQSKQFNESTKIILKVIATIGYRSLMQTRQSRLHSHNAKYIYSLH